MEMKETDKLDLLLCLDISGASFSDCTNVSAGDNKLLAIVLLNIVCWLEKPVAVASGRVDLCAIPHLWM